MLAERENVERLYALDFLRHCSGSADLQLDDATLDEVFGTISGLKTPEGKSPTWIDDIIREHIPSKRIVPPLNLCLSHDVDYVSSRDQARKFLRRLSRAVKGDGSRSHALVMALGSIIRLLTEPRKRERYGDFMDWLRLEESFGFRSTFFFLPYPDSYAHVFDGDYQFSDRVRFDGRDVRVADMMREISSAGWEIGLHGTYNSASQEGLLRHQKESIETIIGREVSSVRQHYLNRHPMLTHRLQANAGFRVDSSVGYTRSVGLKLGTSHPFRVWDVQAREALPLMEVPLTGMDTSLVAMGLHKAGPSDSVERLKQIGLGIASSGGIFCLNWHPHYLPVPQIHEVYVELLSWARSLGAVAHRMDSFADQKPKGREDGLT